jgi:hypothetical protein
MTEAAAARVAGELEAVTSKEFRCQYGSGHSQPRSYWQMRSRHCRGLWRRRHSHQHRGDVSVFAGWRDLRSDVGHHVRHQCDGELLPRDETRKIFADQALDGFHCAHKFGQRGGPKRGSEAYDVSKAALSVTWCANWPWALHRASASTASARRQWSKARPCFRAIACARRSPSTAFAFEESISDDELRNLLAAFYAERTLTHSPSIQPTARKQFCFWPAPRALHNGTLDSRRRRFTGGDFALN